MSVTGEGPPRPSPAAPARPISAADELLLAGRRRGTVGGDKNYDVARWVRAVRAPHVAAKRRYSAIDRRTTRHAGYAISQHKRKLVEQATP